MDIVFVEYRMKEEYRQDCLDWIKELKETYAQVRVYEGTDQRNNFVEIWPLDQLPEQSFDDFYAQRTHTCESSKWRPLPVWVERRIHVWQFAEVLND